jgi:amino-acid N-acetyltransferase
VTPNVHTRAAEPSHGLVLPGPEVAVREPIGFRSARARDVGAIHHLIEAHVAEGHLLPRTRQSIAAEVEQFVVATRAGVVVGCAELVPLGPEVAEVRSLVVSDEVQGQGVGRALVLALLAAAENGPFNRLCAFTHAPAFFVRLGFSIVPHLDVREKVFTDCVECPLFRRCGQQAVVFWLRSAKDARRSPERER